MLKLIAKHWSLGYQWLMEKFWMGEFSQKNRLLK
jgi:hypothetical protein